MSPFIWKNIEYSLITCRNRKFSSEIRNEYLFSAGRLSFLAHWPFCIFIYIFIYFSLFYDTINISDYLYNKMIRCLVDKEFERIKKGFVVAQFTVLSLNFPGRTEANVNKHSRSSSHV
jgi:hypothetical protein